MAVQAATYTDEGQDVVYLEHRALHSVKRENQVLRIIQGVAWITFDAQDWFAEAGEFVALGMGYDEAVITSMGQSPLVYEVF